MDCNCIFCKIVNGDIPSIKLYEDDDCIVILDRFPSVVGHSLVIPKKHSRNVLDIDENMYSKLMKVACKIAKKVQKASNCDGINILQNNEEIAGQTVFHTHIHIIPRYNEDNTNISWKPLDVDIEQLEKFKSRVDKEN